MGRFKEDLRPLISDEEAEYGSPPSLKSEPVIFFTNPRSLVRNRRLRSTSAAVLTLIGLGMAFLVMSVCLVVPYIRSRFRTTSSDVTTNLVAVQSGTNFTILVIKTECEDFMRQCTPHLSKDDVQYLCQCMVEPEQSHPRGGYHGSMMQNPQIKGCMERCRGQVMSKHMQNGNHGNHMPMMPHDGHRHGDHMPHDAADHEPVPSDGNVKDMEHPVTSHGSGDGDGDVSAPADQLSVKPHDDGEGASQMPVMPHHGKGMPMAPHDDMPMTPNGGRDRGNHRPMMPHGDNLDVHRPMMPHGDNHDVQRPMMPHGNNHDVQRPMMPHGDNHEVHRPMMPHGDNHDVHRPMMPHGGRDHGNNMPMMPPRDDDYNHNDD